MKYGYTIQITLETEPDYGDQPDGQDLARLIRERLNRDAPPGWHYSAFEGE